MPTYPYNNANNRQALPPQNNQVPQNNPNFAENQPNFGGDAAQPVNNIPQNNDQPFDPFKEWGPGKQKMIRVYGQYYPTRYMWYNGAWRQEGVPFLSGNGNQQSVFNGKHLITSGRPQQFIPQKRQATRARNARPATPTAPQIQREEIPKTIDYWNTRGEEICSNFEPQYRESVRKIFADLCQRHPELKQSSNYERLIESIKKRLPNIPANANTGANANDAAYVPNMNKISSAIKFVKRAKQPFDYISYFNKCSLNKIACVKTVLFTAIRNNNIEAVNKLRKDTLLKCAGYHFKFKTPFIKKAGPWDRGGDVMVGGEVGVPAHMLSPNADTTYSSGSYGPPPDYVQRRQQIIDQHDREVAEAEAKAAEEKAKAEKEYENLRRSYYVECLLDGYTPDEAFELVDQSYGSFDEWMANQEYNKQLAQQAQAAPVQDEYQQMVEAGYDDPSWGLPPGFKWLAPPVWENPAEPPTPILPEPLDSALSAIEDVGERAVGAVVDDFTPHFDLIDGYNHISLDNLPSTKYMFLDPDRAEDAVLDAFMDPFLPHDPINPDNAAEYIARSQQIQRVHDMFTNPSPERLDAMRSRINAGRPTAEDLYLSRYLAWKQHSDSFKHDRDAITSAILHEGGNFQMTPLERAEEYGGPIIVRADNSFNPGYRDNLPDAVRVPTVGYGYPTIGNAFFGADYMGRYMPIDPNKPISDESRRVEPLIGTWYTNGRLNPTGQRYKNDWLPDLPDIDYVHGTDDDGNYKDMEGNYYPVVPQYSTDPHAPDGWGFQVENPETHEKEWFFNKDKTQAALRTLGLPEDADDAQILNATGKEEALYQIGRNGWTRFGGGVGGLTVGVPAVLSLFRGGAQEGGNNPSAFGRTPTRTPQQTVRTNTETPARTPQPTTTETPARTPQSENPQAVNSAGGLVGQTPNPTAAAESNSQTVDPLQPFSINTADTATNNPLTVAPQPAARPATAETNPVQNSRLNREAVDEFFEVLGTETPVNNAVPNPSSVSARTDTPAEAPVRGEANPQVRPTNQANNNNVQGPANPPPSSWRGFRRPTMREGGAKFFGIAGGWSVGEYETARILESSKYAPEIRRAQLYLALRHIWLQRARDTYNRQVRGYNPQKPETGKFYKWNPEFQPDYPTKVFPANTDTPEEPTPPPPPAITYGTPFVPSSAAPAPPPGSPGAIMGGGEPAVPYTPREPGKVNPYGRDLSKP